MSNTVPSLLLIGIKQEERFTTQQCALKPYEVQESFRPSQIHQCLRHLPQRRSGSVEGGCVSSDDEWQSVTSPASPALSYEVKTRSLLPSAASSVLTGDSNRENTVSTYIKARRVEKHIVANTSELQYPKCEPEDPSHSELTDGFKDDRRPYSRGFMCEICGKSFCNMASVKRHVDIIHKGLRKHFCEICGQGFSQEEDLKNHIDDAHGGQQVLTCDICRKIFKHKRSLRKHVECTHNPLQEYACEFCGMAFTKKRHLNQHINGIHRDPKACECEICGKVFSEKSTMNRHIKAIHKALRPFACEICGRNFTEMGHLKRHINCRHKSTLISCSLVYSFLC
uniref:Zinc finger protein 596 n=1 Tax=Schistocephalus solidus TaxID=70667 RepID=A0A0X3PXB0_SCHSO